MERTSLSESLRKVEAEIAAGRPEQALAHCQELQAWYPRALPIQRVLGEIYLALRKPREALGALDRVLTGDPEDARACCARAIVHQMHGDTMAALAWYRRACDIRPEDQALRSTYGTLAHSLGQPIYRPSRTGLARLYARGDLFIHATREWEALVAETSDNLEAQIGLAETFWRARQFALAEERCRHILANSPSCVKALLILAWVAQHGDRQEEAQRLMQRVGELDPDRRIAQLLFADEIVANDELVRRLLTGDTTAAGQRLAGQFGQSGITSGLRPGVSRPLVNSRPLAAKTTGQPPVSANPQANARPDVGPAIPGSGAVTTPLDPAQMFRETAFMIWGPDEDTREQPILRQTNAPARGQQRDDSPAARPGQGVSPAAQQGGASLDDTEARQAMNWVQWLQAQGAVVRDDALAGDTGSQPQAPLSPNTQPTTPTTNTGFATGAPPAEWTDKLAALGARQTLPLPAPTAEDLRSMFAELEPQTSKQHVVDADVVVSQHIGQDMTGQSSTPHDERDETDQRAALSGQDDGDGAEAPWPPTLAADTGWLQEDHLPDHLSVLRTDNEETPTPTGPMNAQMAGNSSPVLTLENIEQQFAASGFQTFEPRPGALAEFGEKSAPSADSVAVRVEPTPPPTAPRPPDAPAPNDYPARLTLARQRREEGKFDEAVVEYRSVLKNAPDLFGDVLEDLRAIVVATPEHAEVHRLLGDAYIQQGDYLNALESYNRALALNQTPE